MTEPTAPQLEYAPRPALAWVSRHQRVLFLASAVIALSIITYFYRQPLMWRAQWLYWSHRCASHYMPEKTDLIVTDPERAKLLLANNGDYVPSKYVSTASGPAAVYSPRALRELKGLDSRCVSLSSLGGDEPISFLGSLRRPDGESRLVVINGSETNAHNLLSSLRILVIPHAGLFDKAPPPMSSALFVGSGRFLPATLRYGVRDANDPTHLAFTFTVGNLLDFNAVEAEGVLDAYLQNDDSILFKLRDNPDLARLDIKFSDRKRTSGLYPQR